MQICCAICVHKHQAWADTEGGLIRACAAYCLDRFQRYDKSRLGLQWYINPSCLCRLTERQLSISYGQYYLLCTMCNAFVVLIFITNTSRAYYLLFMIMVTLCYKNKYLTIHMHILYYNIDLKRTTNPCCRPGHKRMDMIRAVIQAKLKDTAVWWNGIKICLKSANRFTCPTFFLHWSIFRFSYLVGKETLINGFNVSSLNPSVDDCLTEQTSHSWARKKGCFHLRARRSRPEVLELPGSSSNRLPLMPCACAYFVKINLRIHYGYCTNVFWESCFSISHGF